MPPAQGGGEGGIMGGADGRPCSLVSLSLAALSHAARGLCVTSNLFFLISKTYELNVNN